LPAEPVNRAAAIVLAAIVCIASADLPLSASEGSPDDSLAVEDVVRAWEELRYDDALEMAGSLLTGRGDLTLDRLVELHKVIGFVTFSTGRLNEAENSFRSALSIEPDLQLDSLYVSPKILAFFRDVKARFLTEAPEPGRQEIRYLVLEDRRPAAAVRSLFVPGWGQLYKGERRKGILMLTTAGGTALGALLTHFAMNNAHDRYLEATEPGEIASRYDRYNTLYRVRNTLFLATAVTWAWSYFDAGLRETRGRRLLPQIGLSGRPGDPRPDLRFCLTLPLR
jgi:hypothetical protein